MTVSSEIRKAGPFACNGVTVAFSFSFKCFTSADVSVVHTAADGSETSLTETSQYSVALNGDQSASPGGVVTTLSAYASGIKITLLGDVDYLQQTDITNGGGFFPEVIENSLDKLTLLAQQLKEQVSRALKVPTSGTQTADDMLASILSTQTNAAASAASAAASATLAAAVFIDTSNTSNTIGTGSKSFTVSLNKNFQGGQFLVLSDSGAPTVNYMIGICTSYNPSSGALVANVPSGGAFGSGTKTSWNISLTGKTGADGAVGAAGPTGVTWRGTYAGGTAYVIADAVYYNGSSYICTAPTTGNLPTNTSYWGVLAQQGSAGAGTGDVLGVASSVVDEVALYSDTTGKQLKRATSSGIAKLTSGVLSAVTAPAGAIVGTTDAQILTNKSLSDSTTYVVDDGDGTKKWQWQVSGIASSTTRTWTIPDADLTPAGINLAQSWTAAQRGAISVLTDGATITPNFALANNFQVSLAGNRTLANPTNLAQGQSGMIDVIQDATGSRTLAYNWAYVFSGGAAPTLSTAAGSLDSLAYYVKRYATAAITISIAAPGVVTWNSHGLTEGDRLQITTTGALPTGLVASTTYYVKAVDANTFQLSTSRGGAAITTTGSQSGTHTAIAATILINAVRDIK